jgi:two-component system chemotaxis response regulator CheB
VTRSSEQTSVRPPSEAQVPVVVIGASAGGVEALSRVVASLPGDLNACVLVVLHIPPTSPSALGPILDRKGPLPARPARDGELLAPGQVLVAPPNRHLVVDDGHVALSVGPRENGHRPAIDVLFRTAAAARGGGVVAVVLSGLLDDGAAGAAAVREEGGVVLVQDPGDAVYPAMPKTVIERIGPDAVGTAEELGTLIAKWCDSARGRQPIVEDPMPDENERSGRALGSPSGYICPDCSGTLYLVEDAALLRFRCRVGHAWGADNLLQQQGFSVESALWVALRTLEEKADLSRRLAERAAVEGRKLTRDKFMQAAEETLTSAQAIKHLLEAGLAGATPPGDAAVAPDVGESAGIPDAS